MGESIHVPRAEDKTAAQLERISPKFMLRVTCGFGASTSFGVVASQQMKQVGALEFHDGIGLALFVDEQREGDSRFLAESPGIGAIPKPHGSQVCPAIAKGLLMRAQLRDVLAAEDSPVMTQENHHCWLAYPQRTEPDFFAVYIRQCNHGKPVVEGSFHGATF